MTNDTRETWMPVVGYEGSYEVSDKGRVRSLDRLDSRGHRLSGQMLRTPLNGNGYPSFGPCANGTQRPMTVHAAMLTAFVGPAPLGHEGCHGNGDRTDNRLENLRWGTRSENVLDKVKHGNHPQSAKTHCPQGHPYSPENTRIHASGRRRCRTCERAYKARSRQR